MATKTAKLGLNKPGFGEPGWDALLNQNADTLDQVVGPEHKADGRHAHVHADRVSTGTQTALADGEIAATRIRLPGGTIDSPQQAVTQSLKGAIDGGASAALNTGQPFELLDPSGSRRLIVVDPDRGLQGMLGTIADPLVWLPLRRPEEITGTQAAAGARYSGTATFTRASTATYIDPLDGLIKTAAINQPRFERMADGGIGLLIEGSSTNLLLQSEAFDSANWTKFGGVVTANAIASPDGNTTADLFAEDTTTGLHDMYQVVTGLTGGATYTLSLYVKPAGRGWIELQMQDNLAWHNGQYYDLTNGVLGAQPAGVTATITPLANGWYRLTYTVTLSAGATSATIYIVLANGDGIDSYTGDGTSGVYLWGAQLEQLPFASSYIPTTTAQVTRSADYLSISTAGNLVLNDLTIALDFDMRKDNGGIIDLRSSAALNNPVLFALPSNGIISAQGVFGPSVTDGIVRRMCWRNSATDRALYLDGALIGTTAPYTYGPAAASILIGHHIYTDGQSGHLFGHIRNLRIYDRALTDAEMSAA